MQWRKKRNEKKHTFQQCILDKSAIVPLSPMGEIELGVITGHQAHKIYATPIIHVLYMSVYNSCDSLQPLIFSIHFFPPAFSVGS